MKRVLVILFSISLFTIRNVSAQTASGDSLAQLIKNEEMKNSQVMEIASYLTDVYGPRLTYSPEYKQAADWASSKLKEFGVENVHYENWAPIGKGWSLKSFYAEVIEPRTIPLIAYPQAWSPSLKGIVKGEVVYLNVKSEKDFDNFKGKLKGKFVLISDMRNVNPHFKPDAERYADSVLLKLANSFGETGRGRFRFPRQMNMANFDSVFAMFKQFRPDIDSATVANFITERQIGPKKLQFCKDEGAAAVLTISNGDDGTIFVQQAAVPQTSNNPQERTLSVYDPKAPEVIPQIVVSAENYNRMIRMITKGEKLTMQMELKTEFTKADSAFNIIGEITGTDKKDEVVLIGGHFDSWHAGTGATDNAAGTAVCMEALRLLKKLNLTTRRTIRIGLWAGEEEGLIGSREYVAKHFGSKTQNMFEATPASNEITPEEKSEFDNFCVYLNDDNGTGKFRGIHLQGNEAARPIFSEWLHELNDPDAQTITISNTGGTDHLSFDNAGLPGFQFIQDPIDYSVRTHHSNMDVYERLQEHDLKQSVAMMAFFAYKAAMMDNKFPRKVKN